MPYSAAEIIAQLDDCALQPGYRFPALDLGYSYLADARLVAYRDDEHWGLVLETLICSSKGSGHDAILDELYFYGTCLRQSPGLNENCIWKRTSDGTGGVTFGSELEAYYFTTVSNSSPIRIRDEIVPITTEVAYYDAAGVELEDPPRVQHFELLRWMASRYRHLLLATDEELLKGFDEYIPPFLRLDAWRHPDIIRGEKPGDTETFQMLAEAIATGDPRMYRPSKPPNTHWSNWPMGGSL